MENILINFTSDPSGLQPGIDGLVQMEVADKELADQVKKTSAEMSKRDKAVSDGITKSAAGIEKLSASFKGLDKSIVGGTYQQKLKQLQDEIAGTSDEFKQLALALDFAKKKQTEYKPNSPEWKQLQSDIQAAETLLAAFTDQQDKTEKKSTSLRAQLRGLKEEIAAGLENTGGKITPEIQALIDKAGELDDTMKDINTTVANVGSDTRNIEGLISLASGGVGAFSALQGAIALSGDRSEELEKVLVRLNGVMAILQGIQQVQNVLQKESAATQLILNAQKKISILYTNLETAAESKNVIVRYAAIAAQKGLNLVMSLSPAGVVLLAIGAIAGALLYFTTNTKAAAAAQNEFNEALASAGELLDAEVKGIERANKRRIAALKESGASDQQIADQQIRNSELVQQARKREIDNLTAKVNNETLLNNLSEDDAKKLFDKKFELEQDYADGVVDLTQQRADVERESYLQSLKSATAYAEARVLIAKRGSRDELKAQQDAIRARAAEEQKSNPNLTAGERVKIQADALRQIAQLQFDYDQKAAEQGAKAVQARAELEKDATRERLDLELSALEVQKNAELQTSVIVNGKLIQLKELTEQQKAEIEDRYLKLSSDKVREYSKADAEAEINTSIAKIQRESAALSVQADAATNEQLYQNKKELIDKEAQLEILSIIDSVRNEEERTAKIRAVYAKALADKRQLEKDKAAAENQSTFDFFDKYYNSQVAQNQLILLDEKSTHAQRLQARQQLYAYSVAIMDSLKAKVEQDHADGVLSEEQYQTALLDVKTKAVEQEIELKKQLQQFDDQNRDRALDSAKSLIDGVIELNAGRHQKELDLDKELYDNKLISEKEFNNRKKIIAQEQAADQKAKALFDIAIELGKTIFQIQAQAAILGLTPVVGPILEAKALAQIPFVIGEAVVQGAIIAAKKYKDGEVRIDGPGTNTSDSIPAFISKNESVINAQQSIKHEGALRAINDDRYHQYLLQHELPKLYSNLSMPELPEFIHTSTQSQHFDYEKMAEAFAKEIANNPSHSLHFDENGFHMSVKKGNEQINYVNKKLSM